MLKPILLLATLLLSRAVQDVKVITYSTGRPDTDSYRSLSFWIKSNQRAYIRYARGKDPEDIELRWAGIDTLDGQKGIRVLFPAPDTSRFFILPQGLCLTVIEGKKGTRKLYQWENENKEGSDSTEPCSICPRDEKQAASWLRTYFLH